MDLIDRYVHEVRRHLPARLGADVEAELRSLLTESLDERSTAAGRPPDESMAAEVLREFGKPRDVAARYSPQPQYLIGPRLYPTYVTIIKISIPAYAVATLVLMAFGHYREPGRPESLGVLLSATESFLGGTLFNVGLLTLVFALVERAIHRGEREAAGWDPAKLPPVNDPDRISYFGRIFLLYCVAAVAIVFNFFPDWIVFVQVDGGVVQVVPLLAPAFFPRYLPWLDLRWAAAVVLGLMVLRDGRWTTRTRWIEFGLTVFDSAFLFAVISGPAVFRYDDPVKLVLRGLLVVVVLGAGIDLLRLLRRRHWEPWRGLPAA